MSPIPVPSHPMPSPIIRPAFPSMRSSYSLRDQVTSWRDAMDIDVAASSPYNAPAMSPSSFPVPSAMQWEAGSPPVDAVPDNWPGVEEDYCKDFTCCGLSLPSLHDLLQHYEEHHVLLPASSDDESVLTSPITPSTSSPRSSVDPEGPRTPPPLSFQLPVSSELPAKCLTYNFPAFPLTDAPSAFPSISPHPLPYVPPEVDVMTAFDPLDPNSPAFSVPPSLVSRATPKRAARGLGLNIPVLETDVVEPSTTTSTGRKVKFGGKERRSKRDEVLPEGVKREKPFKCRVPGCTKAYLNSNGLRYHMQKGTCVLTGPIPA